MGWRQADIKGATTPRTDVVKQGSVSVIVKICGVTRPEDARGAIAAGADASLVGETLMRRPDPGEALAELLAGARPG